MSVAVQSEKERKLVDENAEVERIATGFTFTEGPIWMDNGSLHFSDMPGDVEVGANHELSNGRVSADDIREGDPENGGLVDGMKLDERGNVYVAGPAGVWIFSRDGEHLGVIDVPEPTGNLNWGGDDWRSLFVSASTSVYRVRMKVGGNRLGYMR